MQEAGRDSGPYAVVLQPIGVLAYVASTERMSMVGAYQVVISGPCDDERSFYAALLQAARAQDEEGLAMLETAKKMPTLFPHDIVFTHGDLWDHNIMVDQGHITGIVDWEWAGWLPEYWEYTSILQWIGIQMPWILRLATLPGYKYSEEMKCDLALIALSDDTFLM
ncbi:hypothetical protein F5146DRAFT_171719 [Armillaria mellea]|nr:hypothetical protein F5146DRAFT_171719 [Armillaria mellea]